MRGAHSPAALGIARCRMAESDSPIYSATWGAAEPVVNCESGGVKKAPAWLPRSFDRLRTNRVF